MASNSVVEMTKETFHRDCRVYQLDNGTRFYFQSYEGTIQKHKLYVKWLESEVEAKISNNNKINYIFAGDNALYFEQFGKIFRCTFELPKSISVSEVRPLLQNEDITNSGLCRLVREDRTYVFRLGEDYERDGIEVNISTPFDPSKVVGIHRGKALYVRYNMMKPSFYELNENVLIIEVLQYRSRLLFNSSQSPQPQKTPILANDCTPFIYVQTASRLFVFNTDSMTVLPSLEIRGVYDSIIGINKGILTMEYIDGQSRYLLSVQLPKGYFAEDVDNNWKQTREDSKNKTGSILAPQSDKSKELEKKSKKDLVVMIEEMENKIIDLERKLTNSDAAKDHLASKNQELAYENEKLQKEAAEPKQKDQDFISENNELKKQVMEGKVWALASVRKLLKFEEIEKLSKPLIVIQLGDGSFMYFDNVKPFELFSMKDETKVNADLKILEGEFDCSFRGTAEDCAYFSTIRGKTITFFIASIDDGIINVEHIYAMRTSDISLFKNQPLYYIEQSKEWVVYQYNENYNECDGEKFDISEINLLSKYERQYHKGVLFLFRETVKAKIERVNEKVVKVEGPLLDEMSFYTPYDSDFIYIVNQEQNVLLILNTIDLTVAQQCYEPPAGSNHHSIVGIHEGILTMAFDGVWGRHLSTTMLT